LRPGPLLRAALLVGKLKTAPEQIAEASLPLDAGPRVAPGRHLTAIACGRCHGADLSGIGDAGQDLTVRGYYDRAQFHALVGRGEAIGEGKMELMTRTAEVSFSHFHPAEIDAIYDYLDARDGILVARAKLKRGP
jgi:mono/diheme cytochrome c family protein